MTTKQKNTYETPSLDFVFFNTTDILTTSVGGNEDDLPII